MVTKQNYQELAKRTLVKLDSQLDDLLHICLGLQTEYIELKYGLPDLEEEDNEHMVNFMEELGDLYWFACSGFTIIDKQLEEEDYNIVKVDQDHNIAHLELHISRLANHLKSCLAYGKTLNIELVENVLRKVIGSLNSTMMDLKQFGIIDNVEEILNVNITKLKERFPDKFSNEKALKRDTKKEKEAMKAVIEDNK